MMRLSIAVVAAVSIAAISPVLADSEVLGPGKVEVTGALDISLSEDAVGDPVVIGFDVFYGVRPDIDVGLVHTSPERTGFLADTDGGICVGDACSDSYDKPALLARYQLLAGDLMTLVEGGLVVVSLSDPFALSLKLGFRTRYKGGSFFVDLAPNLFVGLAGRTIDAMGAEVDFNKERLHVPIDIGFAASKSIDVFFELGIAGPLANFVDAFNTPVGLGARYHLAESIELAAWFSFRDVFNTEPDFELALDDRSAGVSGTFRF